MIGEDQRVLLRRVLARHRRNELFEDLRIAQVEIDVVYHDRYKGTTIGDGVKIFGDMLRLAVSR